MNQYKFMIWMFGLFLITTMLLGCGKEKTRNIVCVVDFSSSPNSAERQDYYKNIIKNNIIKNLAKSDRIVILPLDRSSTTNSQEILTDDLSTKDFEPDIAAPQDEERLTRENVDKFKNQMLEKFEVAYSKNVSERKLSSDGTDIFGALNNLKSYLRDDSDNHLIFLSDMMNYSSALNMELSNTNFTAAKIDNDLKNVPQVNLQNSSVVVLTGNQPGIPASHFELVKTFWSKYFNQNTAKLYDYSSAGISKLDEMMLSKK